ncbi:cell division protein ZapA [Rhodobium orientis]|uniref:Cell division protein ZapA n=1 Tax=Rhodobium orientis TaxID=34017 RepID=A0A327JUX8_9HYPH|nr:cell division protein ZapA [Rhodobium orientis]MBB4302996.1 cell division protein ZapA [Rhodobium orientis]MBK5949557.1 cell division protein ZapA [Rhodobium orientis]RAI29346.1 cell division protein ZapA [Rhodobium orientis]
MAQVSVTINGRQYRMACDDGEEERLFALARRFDGYIGELKTAFGEIGDQRLSVMAGIMAVDMLATVEQQMKGLEAELESLRESRKALLERSESSEQAFAEKLNAAAARIEDLAKTLDRPNGAGR